jgi:hypothetical protein
MAMAMAMGDGNQDVKGDGDGNSDATETEMETAMGVATATAMEMVMVIAMAMATAMATMTKGGLPLHVPVMRSAVAGVTPCLHPHGHKGVCIHQRCVMGVTLPKVFAPFQGGGFLTAHHGLFFFIFYNYCSVS